MSAQRDTYASNILLRDLNESVFLNALLRHMNNKNYLQMQDDDSLIQTDLSIWLFLKIETQSCITHVNFLRFCMSK